jgi:SLOG family YspA-like protein
MFVILITGSRTFKDPKPIKEKLQEYVDKYGAGDIILRHGYAKGADTLAARIARNLDIKNIQDRSIEFYDLSWDKDGLNAGNIRNERMLDEDPKPDVVLAFPDENSKGTWNTIDIATRKNFEIWVYQGALGKENRPAWYNIPQNPTESHSALEQATKAAQDFVKAAENAAKIMSDSFTKDSEFGLEQEYSAAMLFASIVFPKASIHRLPEYSDLDFAITQENQLIGFIEVKARRVKVEEYSSTILPLRKHNIARSIYENLKIPTYAVIVYEDALVSFHLENEPDDIQFLKRDDRDKGMDHAYYNHSRFSYHMKKDV